MLRKLLLAAITLGFSFPAFSLEAIKQQLPDASIVGEARLSVALWDVYDAMLYAPNGSFDASKPFALSLRYMRKINGKDIADRSVEEMREQGYGDEIKLAAWNTQLKTIFPDVENGTVLSAVFIPDQKKTIFYNGNKQIGIIKDAEFTKWFSDIWLGEKTSEPTLRRKLLGLS